MSKTKPSEKRRPKEVEPTIVCCCCPDSEASQVIRKREPDSSVDDQPWMICGVDRVWRPVRTCPWCRTELG